jgi:hypothetical protein
MIKTIELFDHSVIPNITIKINNPLAVAHSKSIIIALHILNSIYFSWLAFFPLFPRDTTRSLDASKDARIFFLRVVSHTTIMR